MTDMTSAERPAREAIEAALFQAGFTASAGSFEAVEPTPMSRPAAATPHATSRQPVLVATGDVLEIVWANPAACALFGVATLHELTESFRHGVTTPTQRLMEMATHLQPFRLPPAPPRLERLRFLIGALPETITFMVRTLTGPVPLVVFAATDVRTALISRFPVLAPLTLPQLPKVGSDTPMADAPHVGTVESVEAAPEVAPEQAPETIAVATEASALRNETIALAAMEHEAAMPSATTEADVEVDPVVIAPRSVAAVRADLQTRFGDTRILRFLWQTDQQGHLTWITEHLETAVGTTASGILGHNFCDLAARLGLDPHGTLVKALNSRVTWSRVEALWPVEDSEAALPISFGALPALTRDQKFNGFQGYGVIHLQCPTAQISWPETPEPEPDHKPDPSAVEDTSGSALGADTHDVTASPADTAALDRAKSSSPYGENVIHLRAIPGGWRFLSGRSLSLVTPPDEPQSHILPLEDAFTPPIAPSETEAPTQTSPHAEADPVPTIPSVEARAGHEDQPGDAPPQSEAGHVVLSLGERMAFGEIARTLGAAMRTDDKSGSNGDVRQRSNDTPSVDAHLVKALVAQPDEPQPPAITSDISKPEPVAPPRVEDEPKRLDPSLSGSGHALDLLRRVTQASENWGQSSPTQPSSPAQDDGHDAPPAEVGIISPEPTQSIAASSDASSPAPLSADAIEILDKLPAGLLLVQHGTAVHVNAKLLRDLDYPDAASFKAENGVAHIFKGRAIEAIAGPDGGIVPLVTRNGAIVTLNMDIKQVHYVHAPAQLLTFVPESDLAPRTRVLEADLRKSETDARQLQAILDTATDGVAVLDEDGNILSLNKAGQALFGYEQNEVVGHPFTLLLQRDSEAAARDYFAGLKANGVASVLNDGRDVLGRAHQGGAIPLFMTIGPIGTSSSAAFCAVLRDMTAWKRAERELKDAHREAERASSLKSEFLAKVSHEIRTPLNAILGFTEVMMEERLGTIGNARYKEYLSDIHASGSHVMSLVNDLLDLSKIESGKMDLASTPIDANRIINECVSLMQLQANAERVIVRMSLAPRLPAILTDERSLRQIVLNLLSNAVKFNEPGGQVIISTALTDAGHAVIRIRDTGIGMNEADLEIALEPFRQVASNRSPAGTGLGLPLTKALVEANRASFSIKSRRNEGTLVEVAFPPNLVLAG